MPADERLSLSLNEVETTLRKVALGEGWPYALAEEIGLASAWLCAQGHDGIAIANSGICAYTPPPPPNADGGFPKAPSVGVGQQVALYLQTHDHCQVVEPDAVWIILASLAVSLTKTPEIVFSWKEKGGASGLISAQGHSGAPTGRTLKLKRVSETAPTTPLQSRALCAPTLWEEVNARAVRAYVPSSAASRAGAGAGNSDND